MNNPDRKCSRCNIMAKDSESSEVYFETDWGGYGPKVLCQNCDDMLKDFLSGHKLVKEVDQNK